MGHLDLGTLIHKYALWPKYNRAIHTEWNNKFEGRTTMWVLNPLALVLMIYITCAS